MATMVTEKAVKLVYLTSQTPEECIKHAQVVIVTEVSWHLLAPEPYRAHGDLSFAPVPEVTCPIIDLSKVKVVDDDKVAEIIQACTARSSGVFNMDGLVTGLCAVGGVVTPPPSAKKKLNHKRRVSHVSASQ